MFLFLKLVLAHLIADFILQFEELYRLKVRSQAGHFFHAAIHAVMMLLVALPYLAPYPMLGVYLIILAKIHYFQDGIKYRIQAKHPKQIFWCFTIDQIFHFLFLATVIIWPPASTPRPFFSGIVDQLYRDSIWTLYACAFITTTFKTTYLLHAFRLSFIPGSRPDHLITSSEMAWDLAERTFITGLVLFDPVPLGFMLALPIGFLRFFHPQRRSAVDFVLSASCAIVTGFLFRHWIMVLA